MEKHTSAEAQRKRKFLLVLPLLVLPFITMAFWALGGGSANRNLTAVEAPKGFITTLPQAKFNAMEKHDKFSIYETSDKMTKVGIEKEREEINRLSFSGSGKVEIDSNEQQINERLNKINAELKKESISPKTSRKEFYAKSNYSSGGMTSDVKHLEKLMQNLQSDGGEDPEMAQLNSVLDKLIAVQNPDKIKGKSTQKDSKPVKGVFAVHMMDSISKSSDLPFTGNSSASNDPNNHGNTIQAVVHQDQDIISGSVIKIRLLDTVNANGLLIPRNEFIYGIASLDNERLKIEIASLRYRNSIIPVALSVYDLDGLEGLYIPGAITRDASKKGMDEAIQNLQVMTMDPSVSAQVAGAGIQAAKGLFGKRVRQVHVKVKAGYQLLLKDNHQTNL